MPKFQLLSLLVSVETSYQLSEISGSCSSQYQHYSLPNCMLSDLRKWKYCFFSPHEHSWRMMRMGHKNLSLLCCWVSSFWCSEDHGAFIVRLRLDFCSRKFHDPSKCQESFSQQCIVTSQNMWIINNTAVTAWSLTYLVVRYLLRMCDISDECVMYVCSNWYAGKKNRCSDVTSSVAYSYWATPEIHTSGQEGIY